MRIVHQEPAARGMVRVWVEADVLGAGEAVMLKLADTEAETIRAALTRVVAARQEERRRLRREALRALDRDAMTIAERAEEVARLDAEIAAMQERRARLVR